MKYEVILSIGCVSVLDWKFKSIYQVIRFLTECNLDILDADVFRIKDFHHFDAKELLEVFYLCQPKAEYERGDAKALERF